MSERGQDLLVTASDFEDDPAAARTAAGDAAEVAARKLFSEMITALFDESSGS